MVLQGDAGVAGRMGGGEVERKAGPRSSRPVPLGDWPGFSRLRLCSRTERGKGESLSEHLGSWKKV